MSEPSKPSPQQTLDQRRAKHAYQVIAEVMRKYPPIIDGKKSSPDPAAKKFGGQAKKLPMRIIASGLGQALAFVKAKRFAPILLVALDNWVLHKPDGFDVKLIKGNEEQFKDTALLNSVIEGSAGFLRQATDEALAYLLWLNRFCEANKLTDEMESET